MDTFIKNKLATTSCIADPETRRLFNWYIGQDGIIGIPLPETEPAGELTFVGGSTRPSTGFLYPRGDS